LLFKFNLHRYTVGLHRDFPSVRRLGASCKGVRPAALAEYATRAAGASSSAAAAGAGAGAGAAGAGAAGGVDVAGGLNGGGPLYHMGACSLEAGEAAAVAEGEGAWVIEAAGAGVASCEDRVTYVSSGRQRHGGGAGEVQHRVDGTYHACSPGPDPLRPADVQAHYTALAARRRELWVAPVGAVARYVHTRLGTEVTSPVAMWEEGGLRVRVLWYVRLKVRNANERGGTTCD
jgi:hypothetical protein